jgi:hypothetical protein
VKWITRENAAVDRVACPWLIRHFVDAEAEFLFVPAAEVAARARDEEAIPFDVEGVELGHVDGRCSFESIVLKYRLGYDPALTRLAAIVHGADITEHADRTPESVGLKAIASGFRLLWGRDDPRKLELEFPLYDALYRWAQESTASP